MNEQHLRTIEVLNRLYAAERRSLLPRLAEAGAFVSWASAGELAVVRKMVEEENEHIGWLAEAADQCDGVLYPAGPDVHTAHLHYLDLDTMLPQVVRNVEGLVKVYEEAGNQPLDVPAAEALTRILARHQGHLEQLRQLQDRAAGTPA